MNGFLTIVNKLQDNQVKSIKTAEFKAWTDGIVNEGSTAKSNKISQLYDYIKNLPDEMDKRTVVMICRSYINLLKTERFS